MKLTSGSFLGYAIDYFAFANGLDEWFFHKCQHLWESGEIRKGRNGNTRSEFGATLDIDLRTGFPALTVKKMNVGASVAETLAFIQGIDNSNGFRKLGCNFWDANSKSDYWMANPNRPDVPGTLGRVYGVQWRDWRGIASDGSTKHVDQLADLLKGLCNDPYGRRHIVSAWQPAELDQMALPPCHAFFQVYCHTDGGLSLQMYQRSCDLFLGVPFNITSYAMIAHLLASLTGRTVRSLKMVFGDLHLYEVHETKDGALSKLAESVQHMNSYPLPQFFMPDLHAEDFSAKSTDYWATDPKLFGVTNYEHGPFIPASMIE